MSIRELNKTIERAAQGMDRALVVAGKTDRAVSRADRVMAQIDNHDGAARDARRRDYERTMEGVGKRLLQVGLAVGGISIAAVVAGLLIPGGIGMFGFLAAVGLAVAVAAVTLFWPRAPQVMQKLDPALSNAQVASRFDSFLVRQRPALPPPAQVQVDAIHTMMPDFQKVISRIEKNEPEAQEARRLMSNHLPGLIERYHQVPQGFRDSIDGEGMTVDERLADGLSAGRKALEELGQRLARKDMAALEAHGRFMKSRYGDEDEALD